ncbi:MAG: hypothetical protein U0457_14755 [Candidatus Sericytochromatia bacterium]
MSEELLSILKEINTKIDKIEKRIEKLESFVSDGENVLSTVMDTIDNKMDEKLNLERFNTAINLLDNLGKKETLEILNSVNNMYPELIDNINKLKEIPNILNMVVDSIDERFIQLNNNDKVNNIKNILLKYMKLEDIEKITKNIDKSINQSKRHGNASILEILRLMNDTEVKNNLFASVLLLKNLKK